MMMMMKKIKVHRKVERSIKNTSSGKRKGDVNRKHAESFKCSKNDTG